MGTLETVEHLKNEIVKIKRRWVKTTIEIKTDNGADSTTANAFKGNDEAAMAVLDDDEVLKKFDVLIISGKYHEDNETVEKKADKIHKSIAGGWKSNADKPNISIVPPTSTESAEVPKTQQPTTTTCGSIVSETSCFSYASYIFGGGSSSAEQQQQPSPADGLIYGKHQEAYQSL